MQTTLVFDQTIPLELERDAHLVVACIGEGKELGPVMGPEHGKDTPCAVGNPIFVDVDGDGFKPNGDMLGLPLVLEPGQSRRRDTSIRIRTRGRRDARNSHPSANEIRTFRPHNSRFRAILIPI